ncbi:hypothetical protein [Naasia sp. SYSU D00057]|uniref:flavodoxin family protein n=1 Tax=Naasia sp. SYSU D00057 TaxID=2817380 RepID=UPI001B30B973|nr:hypothetical protein [Naasia sp. SYSU D00057]
MLKILIVYESMFGSTRSVAEAVERGARSVVGNRVAVALRRVGDVQPEEVSDVDVLVVGAPTHAHSLSRPESRAEAAKWARDPARQLTLEPDAREEGIREFLATLHPTDAAFVAFDTRVDAPELFTGSAARAIRKRLLKKGLEPLLPSESFLVTTEGRLVDGEDTRAEHLGRALVEEARQTFPATGAMAGA